MEAALCNVTQVQGKAGLVSVGDLIKHNTFVGLYFSAHWCAPCRGFTPKLIEFYNTMKANDQPIEIIFVSYDRDQDHFDNFYCEMPWHAIPYSDEDKRDELADKYDVKGIPYLVIMDSQGTIIDKEGRGTVQTDCGTEIPGKWRKT
ncbi:nucleoredoxin-like [Ostrea edulis]|uniref:nucleoredoxin-like n=1 Tax=Ostrea edulis TaxID=37623 RepID=UPI0020953B88|nr:nucleoredoxin-like [Ostrea edulis]